MIACPQAFWYVDSSRYLQFSYGWQPDFARQAGYSLFLKARRQTGSLYTVSALQHLLGLSIAVAVYALLQRRSVPRWLSVLAVTPILLDAFQLDIEHLVLAETVFTTLIVAGLLAMVWPARLSARSAGVAGLLLALSTTLRTVSLPLVLITAAYLIVLESAGGPPSPTPSVRPSRSSATWHGFTTATAGTVSAPSRERSCMAESRRSPTVNDSNSPRPSARSAPHSPLANARSAATGTSEARTPLAATSTRTRTKALPSRSSRNNPAP
ncbi:MAG: hypothetical protein QOE61_2671 [Micromonosporaceae bacterium]|nr:hypothetical protein [Micromonosporaceae bacterium]